MEIALAIAVVVLALSFDFTNGFHDAANAIATSVSTRALTPKIALGMAAVLNFVGALLGTTVANTIAKDIVRLDDLTAAEGTNHHALVIVVAALIGAITWNMITWWFGLPSSSTHALIGGLVGAGIAGAASVQWGNVTDKVVIPMFLSPLIGFGGAYLIMCAVLWLLRKAAPSKTNRRFRLAQTASAAALALGHGLQDAQKTMGVIFMAAYTVGWADATKDIPIWIKLSAAAAISLGTAAGGGRIMRTLGRKIIEVDPPRGFVAESVSAVVLYVMAMGLHAPVSTTHTVTTAIMGVGATKRLSAVRWGVAKSIVVAWILTLPAAALVGWVMYEILHIALGL